MSDNKQAQPAPKSDTPTQPPPAPPTLTRVPARLIFFYSNEHQDLPGGNGQVSNVKCYREPANSNRWFTADFIPAWQCFEVSYHVQGTPEPEILFIPLSAVKKWTRA